MKWKFTTKCLFGAILALSLSGCLTRRTVTENGQTIESDYIFKRPLKEAVQNSM